MRRCLIEIYTETLPHSEGFSSGKFTNVVYKTFDENGLKETKTITFEENQKEQLDGFLSDLEMIFNESDLNVTG